MNNKKYMNDKNIWTTKKIIDYEIKKYMNNKNIIDY